MALTSEIGVTGIDDAEVRVTGIYPAEIFKRPGGSHVGDLEIVDVFGETGRNTVGKVLKCPAFRAT
jgi:hypothetical protein